MVALLALAGVLFIAPDPGQAAPAPAPAPAPAGEGVGAERPAATADWTPHPAFTLPLTRLDYRHFRIGYDEQAKNPAWVWYPLQGAIRYHGHEQRPTTFATELRTASRVAHHDYSGSGFNRGHSGNLVTMRACVRA